MNTMAQLICCMDFHNSWIYSPYFSISETLTPFHSGLSKNVLISIGAPYLKSEHPKKYPDKFLSLIHI